MVAGGSVTMKILAVATAFVFVAGGSAFAQQCLIGDHHWTYSGNTGPSCWAGLLQPEYRECSGSRQSRIQLPRISSMVNLPSKMPHGSAGPSDGSRRIDVPLVVWNNGHTVQVNVGPSTANANVFHEQRQTWDPWTQEAFQSDYRVVFTAQQLHFHSPVEHKLEGLTSDLEMHLVYTDARGRKLVRALFFVAAGSSENPLIKKLLANAAAIQSRTDQPLAVTGATVQYDDIFAGDFASRQLLNPLVYFGSLTTPPCSEDVVWLIHPEPISATADQIQRLKSFLPAEGNARPFQPPNGRKLYR